MCWHWHLANISSLILVLLPSRTSTNQSMKLKFKHASTDGGAHWFGVMCNPLFALSSAMSSPGRTDCFAEKDTSASSLTSIRRCILTVYDLILLLYVAKGFAVFIQSKLRPCYCCPGSGPRFWQQKDVTRTSFAARPLPALDMAGWVFSELLLSRCCFIPRRRVTFGLQVY